MTLRSRIGFRLTWRVYLVGVLQMVVIAAGFFAIDEVNRSASDFRHQTDEWFVKHARYFADRLQPMLDDPAALEQELGSIKTGFGATIWARDPTGAVIATNASAGALGCDELRAAQRALDDPHGHGCSRVALTLPDGRSGWLEYAPPPPPPHPPTPPWTSVILPFVLLIVGFTSVLLTRWIIAPLRKMYLTAQAFGRGDLAARVGTTRRDELGEALRAFDDMADRVAELMHAEKELVANVAHELRTPLARIRVALDLAAEGDAAMARESLGDIADDLGELERLVDDVLTASRLELATDAPRGIPPLRKEMVGLVDLLRQSASRFQTAHAERPLETEVPDVLPAVEGDPVLLRRALHNLLENAHKYSEDPASPVELTARRDESEVVLVVRDHGIGIAALDLSGVFRPFFRVDRSRTRTTGGLGLGLALTKRIVEAHGGTIVMESEPDTGTTVTMRLPVAADETA